MLDVGKCVFHYTKLTAAVDFILPSMTLLMSSLALLNDPREAKSWPFKFYARSLRSDFDPHLFQAATDFVTLRSQVLCFASDGPDDAGDLLKRGFARPRMWAQYADNHKGVCLAFDIEELNDTIQASVASPVFSGPVEYVESSWGHPEGDHPYGVVYLEDVHHLGLDAMLKPMVRASHNEFFFQKHIDWRDEEEYRWVAFSEDGVRLAIPAMPALRAVFVGADCSDTTIERIVELCRPHEVPVHRIFWHGWAVSMFGNLLEEIPAEAISLNGVSYSIQIPCEIIYLQVIDQHGKIRTISVDTKGNVIFVG